MVFFCVCLHTCAEEIFWLLYIVCTMLTFGGSMTNFFTSVYEKGENRLGLFKIHGWIKIGKARNSCLFS